MIALELDVEAGLYIYQEEMKREVEREKRDRDFWVRMFGGQSNGDDVILDGPMSEAVLGSR